MLKQLRIAFVFLSISLVNINTAEAQDKKLQQANDAYNKFSFMKAAKLYKEAIDKGGDSSELYNKLGDCYYYNGNYAEAVNYYSKGISSSKKVISDEYYLRYAQSLNSTQNYKEAEKVMRTYYAKTGSADLSANWNEIKLKDDLKKESGRYTFKAADEVNVSYSQFAGSIFEKDKLIYASAKDALSIPKFKHSWNEKSFLKLYEADITPDGQLHNPTLLKGDVNTQYHQSSPAITKDGKMMYFSRNNFVDGKLGSDKNGISYLKIYSAENIKGKWTNVKELGFPINSDKFSSANPALSADETELFFVSDRDNKLGNSDLYVVSLNKGGFVGKDVTKLGDEINTLGRETFPYVDASGVLYFSSDGHPGYGGLDVFAAVKDEKGVYRVVNLGDGVNSASDDFAYIINDETKKGYFSSNRSGNDDIYSFTENRPPLFDFNINPVVYGTLRYNNGSPIEGAVVDVFNADLEKIKTVTTDKDGKYSVDLSAYKDYKLVYKKEGLAEKTQIMQPFKPAEKREFSFDFIQEMEIYVDGHTITIAGGDDLNHKLNLKPIYFDYNGSKIRESSKAELDKIATVMKDRPRIYLTVNSHTDSRGRDDFNMKLSENRAKATVKYLVSKGIAVERLAGKGYGETRLINECSNGVKCTEEEHQQNRRSEFIIGIDQF